LQQKKTWRKNYWCTWQHQNLLFVDMPFEDLNAHVQSVIFNFFDGLELLRQLSTVSKQWSAKRAFATRVHFVVPKSKSRGCPPEYFNLANLLLKFPSLQECVIDAKRKRIVTLGNLQHSTLRVLALDVNMLSCAGFEMPFLRHLTFLNISMSPGIRLGDLPELKTLRLTDVTPNALGVLPISLKWLSIESDSRKDSCKDAVYDFRMLADLKCLQVDFVSSAMVRSNTARQLILTRHSNTAMTFEMPNVHTLYMNCNQSWWVLGTITENEKNMLIVAHGAKTPNEIDFLMKMHTHFQKQLLKVADQLPALKQIVLLNTDGTSATYVINKNKCFQRIPCQKAIKLPHLLRR
jgi:hypothetical protein